MTTLTLTLAVVAAAALALHLYKRALERRNERMRQNEYRTAETLWHFARSIKAHTDEMINRGVQVLDFSKILVPSGIGYKISLELSGPRFRIYAVPERYNRTGCLSFYVDNTLTVRASDRAGAPAAESDPEYNPER
jgi:hypothetical protein